MLESKTGEKMGRHLGKAMPQIKFYDVICVKGKMGAGCVPPPHRWGIA